MDTTSTTRKIIKKLVIKKRPIQALQNSQQVVVEETSKPNSKEEWKSFRLFDFETYDCAFEMNNYSDSDSLNSNEPPRKKKPKTFIIQMFGINEIGETVSITITDFKPYFYIQVGPQWTEKEHTDLIHEIKERIGSYWAMGIINSRLEKHSDLYHFNGSQQVFIRLSFQNTAVMNQVKNLWFCSWAEGEERRKTQPFRFPKDPKHPKHTLLLLFESNIPPLLRCFHIHDISPSGWINIPVDKVDKPLDPQTTCTYEYVCKISQLKAQPEKEAGVPYKICSFDIEASSSHGHFPLPVKNYRSTAIQIYDTFSQHICNKKTTASSQKMDELLTKLVLSAFRFKRFEGIENVFPKHPPTQTEIEQAILQLLKSDVTIPKENSRLNDLLSIDQIYKKSSIITENSATGDSLEQDGDGEGEFNTGDNDNPVIMTKSFSQWLAEPDVADRDTKINTLNRRMTALFPALEGDRITFIGSTFVLQGQDLPYKNHCLTLGDCGPVENAEIQCCKTEKDLLLAWTELIQKENPDIMVGYNIFGFDYDFMFRRAQENDCAESFMCLSRKRGHLSCKRSEKTDELSLDQKKIVIASGPFDMKYFNMIGRFQIDLYTYFRREFNLSSYKLDDVAGEYICDKIINIDSEKDNTVIYSKNLKGLQVGDYVHLMTVEYTTEYLNGGQKYSVLEVNTRDKNKHFVISGKVSIPSFSKNIVIRWGLAKDDVSPQDIFRMANGTLDERAKVAKYCIQDCNIVQQLLMKIDVLTGYNEMARICSVPMKFLVFRGQGIKLTSCMAKFCRLRNTLMPDLTAVEEDVDANYDYEGAIVLPPKCGMYIDIPVACVDYSSLYPTIIISNNLSQDSKVWVKEYDNDGKLVKFHKENAHYDMQESKGYDYIDIEYENFTKIQGGKKKITGKTVCRFAQFPDEKKGIIPSILEDILIARKKTRKMAEAENDEFMKNILDKRQLAYKVTANSIYGQCGSRTSTFYDKDIAACTTATGRKMILYAKKMVEDVYGNHRFTHPKFGDLTTSAEYIYGDTDSVFMTFHIRRFQEDCTTTPVVGKEALEITIELAKEVARLCSMNLKKPMELTYEKTLMPFIILSKKRYVGMLYEDDIEHCKLKFMGLSIKRRDCCDYLKDVFGGVLNRFLYNSENKSKTENVQSAIDFLQNSLKQLILGKVPIEKLTITKSLRDYYKTPQQIAHWVLAQRIAERDPGNKPRPGERMKYAFVVVSNSGKRLLQGDKIETPAFIHQTNAKLDYHHYITNQLMKPLLQLFGLVVEDILEVQGKKMDLIRYRKELVNLKKNIYDSPDSGMTEDSLLELWTKRREKLNDLYAHDALFRPTLTEITNKQNGLKNISQYFLQS